jgi:hypothetical protein
VTGWSVEKIAQKWIELMDRLGYERWVAQGGGERLSVRRSGASRILRR